MWRTVDGYYGPSRDSFQVGFDFNVLADSPTKKSKNQSSVNDFICTLDLMRISLMFGQVS